MIDPPSRWDRRHGRALAGVAIAILVLSLVACSPTVTPTPPPAVVVQPTAAAPTATSETPTTSPSSSPAPTPIPTAAPPAADAFVRVDQLGYVSDEHKIAFLLAAEPAVGAPFAVVDAAGGQALTGTVGASSGAWNKRYTAVQPLDISALTTPGTYRIVVGDPVNVTSPSFAIGSAPELFGPRVDDAVAFFQAQRDGPDVIAGDLGRQPSHLNDSTAKVYAWPTYEDPDSDAIVGKALKPIGGPVDLAGGWFDAGDFIKFTHTTAYSVGLMYAAMRALGPDASADLAAETRFGQDWLDRAWDADTGTLYIQVGIGSGNTAGTFNGDHDLWRLPEKDDALSDPADRYLRDRPAFRAGDPGAPLPPNLAGRMAAAFALAAQVDAVSDPARARSELDTAARIFAGREDQGREGIRRRDRAPPRVLSRVIVAGRPRMGRGGTGPRRAGAGGSARGDVAARRDDVGQGLSRP